MPTEIASRRDSNGSHIAASVVIYRGAEYNASGRRRIAQWLRRQAAFLEKHANRMAPKYTATWRYD